ncbi:MAG: ABC transporter ATP-binding protein [Fuerstiella sp.]
MSTAPVIQVTDLKKTYRRGFLKRQKNEALAGVTLEVPKGSIFGLLGPNGAGKTTLIKVLLGLVRKTAGQATVLGLPAGSIEARSRIGYLPENHRIPQHLTGTTALEYFGGLSGLTNNEIKTRSPILFEQVGLKGRESERVSGYSKGMQQRLGLAQAMLHQPELIVLDEPTDGVDPVGRREIRQVLRRLADDGTTIFLNSHLLQEIELVCESVAILSSGLVRKIARVSELTTAIHESPMVFRIACSRQQAQECLSKFELTSVKDAANNTVDVLAAMTSQSEVDQAIDSIRAQNLSLLSMKRNAMTLEEAFIQIVGKDLS